jgi:hypothetical protein
MDDEGVDLIVRVDGPDRVRHFDIQVKSVAGYNRIYGIRLPRERCDEFVLVLHFRHEDRSDEFYYLSGEQVARHLVQGSKFRDLLFEQAERVQYAHQDLAALALFFRSHSIKPSPRAIQVAALRYVNQYLGGALRVGSPRLQGTEWLVEVLPREGTEAVGQICLNEWGDVIPSRSATYQSVRSQVDAECAPLPAA